MRVSPCKHFLRQIFNNTFYVTFVQILILSEMDDKTELITFRVSKKEKEHIQLW